MHRLTSDRPVSEMSMTELAHNSCYAQEQWARYRNYDLDIDAIELIMKLYEFYCYENFEYVTKEDFNEWITNYMIYDLDSLEGLLAAFYTQIWAMADLHERLKKYENMQEKVINRIEELKSSSNYPHFYKGQMVEDFEWVLNLLN